MFFWALWEAHFFNPAGVCGSCSMIENSEPLGNSTRIRFSHCPLSRLNPWDLRSNLCQTGGLNGENFSGKLKATCDAQKRHQAGTTAGTRNRNLNNLKLKQAWRPEPAESYESDDDEDFPRPGLRCHKLFHPQCHLWGETHSEGKAMNCFYDIWYSKLKLRSSNFHKPSSYD